MRDVAALAGVSLKTVSSVVNESRCVRRPARTGRRAVDRLDYPPNLAASNLRRSRGTDRCVGALVQDVSNSSRSASCGPRGRRARARQCVVLAASIDEERRPRAGARRRPRGPSGRRAHPHAVDREQSYLVCRGPGGPPRRVRRPAAPRRRRRQCPGGQPPRGREAVAHLLAHGHTRVAALVDLTSIPTAAARLRGYEAAPEVRWATARPAPGGHGAADEGEAQEALTR